MDQPEPQSQNALKLSFDRYHHRPVPSLVIAKGGVAVPLPRSGRVALPPAARILRAFTALGEPARIDCTRRLSVPPTYLSQISTDPIYFIPLTK
jgi:hypothetical protein